MTLYECLKGDNVILAETAMRSKILIIRCSKNTGLVDFTKRELFLSHGKYIVQHVHKFFNNVKKSNIDAIRVFHTREDICNECYCIFSSVVLSFDLKRKNNFTGYFRKALNQGLYRLMQKHYTNHKLMELNTDTVHLIDVDVSETMLMSVILESSLDDLEKLYCVYNLTNSDNSEFCLTHGITVAAYNKLTKTIKEKLQDAIKRDS